MRLNLIICGLTLSCLSSTLWADPQSTSHVPADGTHVVWRDSVSGLAHLTEGDVARENARKLAAEHLGEWLRSQHPDLKWTPHVEDLDRFGIVHDTDFTVEDDPNLSRVKLTFHVTQDQHDDLLKWGRREQFRQLEQARLVRSEQRQLVWGKILGALVILLGLFAAWFRLEDATQGYLTRGLQVTLMIGVAATLAGLWLIL